MESQLLSIVPSRRARGAEGKGHGGQLSFCPAVLRIERCSGGDTGWWGSIGAGETGGVQVVVWWVEPWRGGARRSDAHRGGAGQERRTSGRCAARRVEWARGWRSDAPRCASLRWSGGGCS